MTEDKQPEEQVIGWDGVTVQVPADWSLASVTADEKDGYLRADDGDMPRLEIKWASTPGFVNLTDTIDKYLATIAKRAQRDKQELTVDRQAQVISKRKMHKESLDTFAWRAGQQAYSAVWVCKQCDRTVIAQVLGPLDDPKLLATAQQVLSTIKDHPTDGWVTWAAYGFLCRIPEDFALDRQEMFPGLIKLSFTRDSETITVGRWGMAEILLRDQSLDKWLETALGKELRRYDPQSEQQEFRGHPAVAFSGVRMALLAGVKGFVRHLGGKRAADKLVGYAWHCEQENKIFVVHALLDRANYDLANEIRDRVECHK